MHIILIDPLEKLVLKKDSSLLLALTMKQQKIPVCLCFVQDLFLVNHHESFELKVWSFKGTIDRQTSMITNFVLGSKKKVKIAKGNELYLHMRLDPPFDKRYLQVLWLLQNMENFGVKVINSAGGIASYNEKCLAYFHSRNKIPTFVGHSQEQLRPFLQGLKREGYKAIVMKPLDLYQGIGVEKYSFQGKDALEKMIHIFAARTQEAHTPLVVQPFLQEIYQGEVRSTFFAKKHLGSILKVPQEGKFLANVAQGSSFTPIDLNPRQKKECQRLANELFSLGIYWIAFDIIGDYISEVNITCPGLLVEISKSHGQNLALEILELL